MSVRYGTLEWFENMFKQCDDDPWGHNWRGIEQYRYDLIIKFIKKHISNGELKSNKFKIIDIGCTTGDFTNRLYELNKNVIGIDISKTAINRAKAKFNHIDFRIDSLPKSSFQNKTFDLITCLEVLYYMDYYTQKKFLSEINKMLKKEGVALVTSVMGEKPYFESAKLISLLSKFFEIKAIEYYGSKAYSRIEAILFTKYQQINKIQRLMTLNYQNLEEEINNFNCRKKRIIRNMIHFIIKFKFLIFITDIILKLLKSNIKLILSLKFPAKAFHYISKIFSLELTHTFVLIGKNG